MRRTPLQRRTPLRSYTSLKSKAGIGTKKKSVSSPKKKQRSISKLHEDLWELCKQILRNEQPNECYTCGELGLEGSNWQTGHGPLPKAVLGLRYKYDMDVLRSQCLNCNKWRGGMGAVFLEKWLREKGWSLEDYNTWKIEAKTAYYGSRETRLFLEGKIEEYKRRLSPY